jgi:hypothetical protein
MNRAMIKRLVLYAVIGTTAAMLLMVASFMYPGPLLLVVAMSVGQGLGLLSLALYLLAVALDLQTSSGGYFEGSGPVDEPMPQSTPEP